MMVNPLRGEVALPVGETTYKLCFSVNAICSLEGLIDKSINEIIESLQNQKKVRLQTIRALLWAALSENHPEVTLTDAGTIAQAAGTIFAMEKVTEAMSLAFPSSEAKSDEPRPT